MRVLLIVHGFPPGASGGAELYARMHADALVRAGDDVLVLTREADPGREEFAVRSERAGRLEIAWVNNTFGATRSFADTYTDDRVDAIACDLIDSFRPDVAHVHHLTCLSTTIVREIVARGVPVFCTLHDYWLLCHRGQLLDRDLQICASPGQCGNCLGPEASMPPHMFAGRAFFLTASKLLPASARRFARGAATSLANPRNPRNLQNPENPENPENLRTRHVLSVLDAVTHFFAPSKDLRDRFVAAGVDPGRITVSEYGWSLPAEGSTRGIGALTRTPAGTPVRFGFIGSLMVSKAPHLLLEACAGLPANSSVVHLFGDHAGYHGDDSYRARLAPLLRGANLHRHGQVRREELAAALAQIDVLVVPSVWPENSPLVIREAFLAGVPVVASKIGGIPETVTDGVNGLLFTPGEVADLRRVLRRLVDEPDLLPTLRSGIPVVRTVEDDVRSMRARYTETLRTGAARPRLAAVVLNYGTPDDTFLATRSLLLSSRPIDDVIVVDNDESGACPSALAPLMDRISYLPTGRNLGFSGGMNAGIRLALDRGAEAVLLINSDVVIAPDCVETLERVLQSQPEAGIAGPIVLGRSRPDRIASLGLTYNDRTGRMKVAGNGAPPRHRPSTSAIAVQAITGCAMLVRKSVFDAIGCFDPDSFFSFEDLDFCLRAGDAGFATVIATRATALHEGGRSLSADPARRLYYGARNHLWLVRRRGGPGGRAGAALRTGHVVALSVAHAIRARGGTLFGRLQAVARGTRDFFGGSFGPISSP